MFLIGHQKRFTPLNGNTQKHSPKYYILSLAFLKNTNKATSEISCMPQNMTKNKHINQLFISILFHFT